MTANEEDWDLDTDEIRSIDSEELYQTRPNRWKGNRTTWLTLTEEERLLWRSSEQIRNRDLSIHLYNTFVLKNRPNRAAAGSQDADPEAQTKTLEEIVDRSDWRPPDLWTAWPMSVTTVPGDDFMKETHDEDDEFTTRSNQPQLPSTVLEEEITANILRQAKERFRRRQRKWQKKAARERTRHETTTAASSAYSSNPSDDEGDGSEEQAEGEAEEEPPAAEAAEQTPKTAAAKRAKTYEPVVSANDELSEYLLRPSVRHILSDLDNTLTLLHNSRLAGLSYMTDSSASATDASDTSDASDASDASASTMASRASKRGRRGRPRSTAPRTPPPQQQSTSGRRGRPRKVHLPLPGESQRDMEIRIARQQKKRIPYPSDDENNPKDNADDGDEGQDADSESGGNNEDDKAKSPRKKRDLAPEDRQKARIKAREDMLGVWGLRDWSDVLGAAALSGFKPEAVARAAQRCANLFGQSMDLTTLVEGPATKGPKPQTTRYAPNNDPPRAQSQSSSESEDEKPAPRPRRQRRGSLARDSVPPSDSDAAGGRRARSTSRSSSLGLFFCPVAGCEGAVEGFSRRANLQRHVARVHPGQAVDVDEVGSEDEMHGAVHVDGFLRPIRPRKGWRAEDTGVRKRKRHYRGRRLEGSDGSSNGSEADVGEQSVWDST